MIVTLLTDYGRDDDFVGVCHGVIRTIHPDADIVDITHGIERYAVRQGALVLRNTLPYMPVGVHVAVVDPQVGTERRAIALRTGDGRIPRRTGQRSAQPGVGALRGRRPGGGHHALAAPSRTRLGHVPRPRHLRPGGRLARPRRGAGRRRDPLDPETLARVGPPIRVRSSGRGGPRACDRPLRQRGLNVDHDGLAGQASRSAAGWRWRSVRRDVRGHVRPDVRRCERRRAARVPGRLPNARAGDQPRGRRRDARAEAGRRAATPAAMIGSPRVHHRLTDSTNERAKGLALAGAPHGTLVTADEQTAGRGRQVASGQRRHVSRADVGGAAVAGRDAAAGTGRCCRRAVAVEAAIKWPNDVWIDGRKVAGILWRGGRRRVGRVRRGAEREYRGVSGGAG